MTMDRNFLRPLFRDFRYAVRQCVKNPGFTLVVVTTLALGIGSSTAIFSVFEAVLLRPMPYPQQERIVELRELDEKGRGMAFAEPNYKDLALRSRSFEALAEYKAWPQSIAGGTEPVRANACAVSPNFFEVLGVQPLIGRLSFATSHGDVTPTAVVSHRFWNKLLQGRTDLRDSALRFADRSFDIIGVLPAEVEFPSDADVWYPASINPPVDSRTAHNWNVMGRLRAGVSMAAAKAELANVGRQLKQENGSGTDAVSFGVTQLRERLVKDVRGVLLVLCGAVGLLLLIACSNVANLLLVRATVRRKEFAVRAAIGASRARLISQLVTESIVLTVAAGALGLLFAYWSVNVVGLLYHESLPRAGALGINASVLIFAIAISLLVGTALGFVPALHAFGRQLHSDLQDAGRGTSAGRSHTRFRNILIVAEIALTLLLLVSAGLLVRSFQELLAVNPGFQTENAVAMTVSRPTPRDPAESRRLAQFYHELLERIATIPSAMAVGGTSSLPLTGSGGDGTFIIEDGAPPPTTIAEFSQQIASLAGSGRTGTASFRVTSAGYFSAMGIPLLRGRLFQESDGPDSQHVAVVSESLVRRFWPNGQPIGKQIEFGNMDGDLRVLNIIGVVGDVRDDALEAAVQPTVYVDYFQRPNAAGEFSIVARGGLGAEPLTSAMRQETRTLDPEMPLKFESVRQIVAASLNNRRFTTMMLGAFAVAALALAMVGLYGIMSYISAQRTTEIGIRMAVGAGRPDMFRLILRKSLGLVGVGIAVGTVLAAAATRLLTALLFGVGAMDLRTYSIVTLLLVLVALAASYVPARRAMSVDPCVALRHE